MDDEPADPFLEAVKSTKKNPRMRGYGVDEAPVQLSKNLTISASLFQELSLFHLCNPFRTSAYAIFPRSQTLYVTLLGGWGNLIRIIFPISLRLLLLLLLFQLLHSSFSALATELECAFNYARIPLSSLFLSALLILMILVFFFLGWDLSIRGAKKMGE